MDTRHINLLDLIERDTPLKRVASTGGGEYHGPCPFCGGTDRFIVQPDHENGGRWSCRQCSPHWQDAIAYIMQRYKVEFVEACKMLNLRLDDRSSTPTYAPPRKPRPTILVSKLGSPVALEHADWQQAAADFCRRSQDLLWGKQGRSDLDNLRQRGLTDAVIEAAGLGFNPQGRYEHWSFVLDDDVWLPKGIVIPWICKGRYWRINIRRPDGCDPKYLQPKGCANGLYRADHLKLGCTVILVEGEFDALAVLANVSTDLVAEHDLVPLATGSANGARLSQWVIQVSLASRVFLAFDTDHDGEQAASWWATAIGSQAQRMRPTHHDITDMVKAGVDLTAWLQPVLD